MKYIGRTHLNPTKRWGINGRGYDKRNVFGKAIEEFGWDNFTHEILEYGILGLEVADEIERSYIQKYNTLFPNGYNTEDGGINGKIYPDKPKAGTIRPDKTGWKHSESTKKKISDSNKLYNLNHPHRKFPKRSKPVDMFSMNGVFIRTFHGAFEASEATGIDVSTISKVCKDVNGRYKSAGGYIWKYHVA